MAEIRVRRFEQIRDLLEYAIQLHQCLRDWLDRARGYPQEKKVALLLDYLAEREQRLITALKDYLKELEEEDPKVLEIWLPYPPDPYPWHEMLSRIAQFPAHEGLSFEEIDRAIVGITADLITILQNAYDENDDRDVRAVLGNIIQLEQQEERQLARNISMMADL